MNPTRLIRKPFIALAYKVTLENMPILSNWCGGKIVPAENSKDGQPFIRVETSRPSPRALTEARVDCWIVASFHLRRPSFKVYTESRLTREFNFATEDDDLAIDELEIDPEEFERLTKNQSREHEACCGGCQHPTVPKQPVPTPAVFRSTTP